MLSLACHNTTFHASSSACICDDACSYALCAACCRSARVRTCHARPSHIVHCSDIVGVPAKGSARNALVLCSCSCKRHALHVLRVRWCAQAGRVLPKNSGTATLQLRKSLETSGRALTQKRKNAGASWKKGVRFLSPGLVCRASAGHFLGPFSGPPFFVCAVQGSTNVAFDCRVWSGGRSPVLKTPHRTLHKCSFTASPPPRSLHAPRNALSQPRRPP